MVSGRTASAQAPWHGIWGLGFRDCVSGCSIQGLSLGFRGLGCRVSVQGLGVYGSRLMV